MDMVERHPRHEGQHRRTTQRIAVGVVALVAIALCLISFMYYRLHTTASVPIPAAITKNLPFPLLYPSPIPDQYSYKAGSARYTNGVLFFSIVSGSKIILVSEQVKPSRPTQIQFLKDFSPLEVPAGTAYAGEQSKAPTVLLETNQSLITLSGSADVPSDIVYAVAKALQPVAIE